MRLPSLAILLIEAETPPGECTACLSNVRVWPMERTAASIGLAVLAVLQGYDQVIGAVRDRTVYAPNALGAYLDRVGRHTAELSAISHELLEAEADAVRRWAGYPILKHGVGFACDPLFEAFGCIYDICLHALQLCELQAYMAANPPSLDWHNHRLWEQALDSLQWALGFAVHVAGNLGCPELITGNFVDCNWQFGFDPRTEQRYSWLDIQVESWRRDRHKRAQLLKAAAVPTREDAIARDSRVSEKVHSMIEGLDVLITERAT